MKGKAKVGLVAVMSIVLAVSAVSVGWAALGIDNPGKFCNDNSNFGVDHNTCVVCANKGKGNAPTCICKAIGDVFGFPFGGLKNHGQCVKFVKNALP